MSAIEHLWFKQEHSDSRFESIRRFVLGELIRFVKKSAIRFGRCIRLIIDHTPPLYFAQRRATNLAYVM